MVKGTDYDVDNWIDKIKKKGLKKFRFRELPDELKNKKMLMKAAASSRLIKVDKDRIKTWQIREGS